MTDSQFNNFIFENFLERRFLNLSNPNFLFGLVDSPRVSIVADLKFRRLTFLRRRNIWVLKCHHVTKYNTFLRRLIGGRHIKLAKAQMQKIKTDLNDNGFNVDTLYKHTNMFNDNFYFKKKEDFVSDQTNHLNFKFEIDSKNPCKEKQEIIESTNTIYKRPDKFCYLIKLMKTYIVKLKKKKKKKKKKKTIKRNKFERYNLNL